MKNGVNVGSMVFKNFWYSIGDSCRWIYNSIADGMKSFPLVSRNFGKSVWSVASNRDLAIGFGSAVLLHFLLFLLFVPRTGTVTAEYPLVEEITFLDNTYPPQVAKFLPSGGGFNGSEVKGEALPVGLAEAPDLMRKIDRNQVAVKLDRYAPAGALTDVIKISKRGEGGGLTTAEILAEAPISLRRAAPPGIGGGVEGILSGRGPGGGIGKPLDLTVTVPPVKIPSQTLHQTKPTISKPTTTINDQTPIRISYSVTGQLQGRQVVAKVLPVYPEWARERGLTDVQITMRLEVAPDGAVRPNIILERSSGYPQWDQAAMAALATWQFAPLAANVRQELQWGEITFIFRLTM